MTAPDILLIEDNPGDVKLTEIILRKIRFDSCMHVVPDGVEALKYLRREQPYESARRPDLILMDLNLPKLNGREVLAAVKRDPDLCTIPVVVLSSSEDARDIGISYQLHANSYISKTSDLTEFAAKMSALRQYWFDTVQLPPRR